MTEKRTKGKVEFTDENIQLLFGYDDAESEPISRLKEYYFKNETFTRMNSELPIKILVGFKGIGKSALIKVSISENKEKGILPILIKPDDIAELGKSDENFLLKIRQWKVGLTRIIAIKALEELGIPINDAIQVRLNLLGLKPLQVVLELAEAAINSGTVSNIKLPAINSFLSTRKIIIYLDDLDRGWEGKRDDITRLSALLNCVRDLANDEESGMFFRVALRTDVYFLVRNSDESTDKIDSAVIWYSWTHHEIFVMLIKRILTFFGDPVNEDALLNSKQYYLSNFLESIMVKKFEGKGQWANAPIYRVLMTMIRKRPRDLVKLCRLASRAAYSAKSTIIRTEHFETIFERYSQDRLQDTINEYRTELPGIEKLLWGMKLTQKELSVPDSFVLSSTDLRKKIGNILNNNRLVFANSRVTATPQELEHFMYKINFITARKRLETGEIQRKYFEENNYLANSSVNFGYDWEIHPAYRWCLQPDSIDEIFRKLSLSSFEN